MYKFGKLSPGKIDSLFPISHFLDIEAGGQYFLIILKWSSLELFFQLKITRGIRHFRITCKQEGMTHWKGNNEHWGGRVLVDAGGDGKQGIYFAWSPLPRVGGWRWGFAFLKITIPTEMHMPLVLSCCPYLVPFLITSIYEFHDVLIIWCNTCRDGPNLLILFFSLHIIVTHSNLCFFRHGL